MKNKVYKSDFGRELIESFYQDHLAKFFRKFEQIFIPTSVGKTHILKFGKSTNPPLIMLHGTASNSSCWIGNVDEFTDKFCVYCVDIPGEPGLSEPIRMKLASEMPHFWLNDVMKELKLQKSNFVTMSLGSWFALNFAIQYPAKVKSISMLTTSGITPAKSSFIFKVLLFMMLGKLGNKLLNKAIYHKTSVPLEAEEFQRLVSKYFFPVMEPIPIFDDSQLQSIKIPVQYFGGDKDNLLNSFKTAQRLKALVPQSEINLLEDTGHVIIDQFFKIKEFLTSSK